MFPSTSEIYRRDGQTWKQVDQPFWSRVSGELWQLRDSEWI